MKKRKKLLPLLMAVIMILLLLPTAAMAENEDVGPVTLSDGQGGLSKTAEEEPEEASDIGPLAAPAAWGADYDTADSFTISSKEDLMAFAAMVNEGKDFSGKTVTLAADIDLNDATWTPIGNGARSSSTYTGKSFKGTFDGKNHIISNLTINSGETAAAIGLFGVVDGGTVKNLTLSNVSIDVNSEQAGSAIGLMVNNATAAGITVSSGSVSSAEGAGGIVGRMIIEGTISNCENCAAVTVKAGNSNRNAGGIVGTAYYNAEGKNMYITDCVNHGAVTGTNNVGGIVALSAAHVSGCENNGAVNGSSSYSVGGIVGEQQSSGSITNNTNKGTVTGGGNNTSDYGTGGIVGWVRYSGTSDAYPKKEVISVTNNTNTGSVTSQGNDAGGIIGVLYNAGTVTGNENRAEKIESKNFAAGIVGNLQAADGNAFKDQLDIQVTNNISTTKEENIKGSSCTDPYAYNNNRDHFVVKDNGGIDTTWAAEVDGERYITIQAAIDAAKSGNTVTLLNDTTEDITIASGKTITFDLNGKTLANERGDTISNYGTLIIKDSGTNGTVDNVTNGKGALVNYVSGIATLNSGTLTRSAEASGNSWYTIKNLGTMEINGGTVTLGSTITNFSSLIDNGWYSGNANPNNTANDRNVTHTSKQVATLTINGGTFSGGKYTVKNDDYGEMTINEGTFNAFTEACVLNWNVAEIAGGTFTGTGANEVIYNGAGGDGDAGQLTITGGQFTSGDNCPVITGASDLGTIEIKSGTFIAGANGDIISTSDTNPTIKVSGGNYSESIPVDYLDNLNAELYSTAKNENAPYSYYENVSAALVAAQAGDTVKDLSKAGETEPENTVTLNYNNGSTSNVTVKVRSNETITLPTPTLDGYTFLYWQDATGKTYTSGSTLIVAADITLTAQWRYNSSSNNSGGGGSGSTTYSVSVDTAKNGSVTVSPKSASKGTTVTITAKPDKGYEVDEVVVTDKNGKTVKVTDKGNNKYTFTMPAGKVDVEVTFVKEYAAPAISFDDVKANAWYYDAAIYAAENGLMSGTGNGNFSPDMTTSRAMIWTTLARLDGQNVAVTSGNWYDKAQSWAVARGVSDGTSPDAPITREQLAVMLYGFAKDQGYTTKNGVSLSRYTDASAVSPWAAEALEWAVGNGLISSMGNNILAPTGTATRAQVAVILMNFCENIAK